MFGFEKLLRNSPKNDPLRKEKALVGMCIGAFELYGYPQAANRQKNALDSNLYRMKGNDLFKSKTHDRDTHLKILERYSQSVALAPNKSEELAMAYGNRSALLLHLKEYKECLKDCNRAINITESEMLRAKLTCRKLECLQAIRDNSFENEYETALNLIMQTTLDDKVKKDHVKKMNDMRNDVMSKLKKEEHSKHEKRSKKSKKQSSPLDLFQRQKKIPCASESVTLEYNEKWGRHVVATRKIDPGEIIVVEKHYLQFVYPECMYWCCSYCTQFTWASIPCESCIYGVYCSEKCRAAAWEEYHKFECKVFPHLWDIDEDKKSATQTIRFFLSLIHVAGGIEKLRQEFDHVQNSKDPCTRGFSDDGVFRSDDCRSFLGLTDYSNEFTEEVQCSFANNATTSLYYLVKKTDLFGGRSEHSLGSLFLEDNMINFAGALFLRLSYLPIRFGGELLLNSEPKKEFIGSFLSPFCGFFNHSCDPNVVFTRSKHNETLVHAKHPIKKGEQIFVCYSSGDYYNMIKLLRLADISMFRFTCECLACENNWTSAGLPSAEDFLKINVPSHRNLLLRMARLSQGTVKDMFRVKGKSNPEIMKELAAILKELADKATVHCHEYEAFHHYLQVWFLRTYGPWLDVPEIC